MIELDDVKVRAIYGGSVVEEGSERSDLSDGGDGGGDGADAPGCIPTTRRVKTGGVQTREVGMWEMF